MVITLRPQFCNLLDNLKVVQGDGFEKELKNIEEIVDQHSIMIAKEESDLNPSLPKVIFDHMIYKEIDSFGITSAGNFFLKHPSNTLTRSAKR